MITSLTITTGQTEEKTQAAEKFVTGWSRLKTRLTG